MGSLSISTTVTLTDTAGLTLLNRTVSLGMATNDLTKFATSVQIPATSTVTLLDLTDTSDASLLTPVGGSPGMNTVILHVEEAEDADGIVIYEFTTDVGDEVGDESFTIATRKGHTLILTRDGSYAGYTSNFAGGELDKIERIRVRNLSAGTPAKISIYAIN